MRPKKTIFSLQVTSLKRVHDQKSHLNHSLVFPLAIQAQKKKSRLGKWVDPGAKQPSAPSAGVQAGV